MSTVASMADEQERPRFDPSGPELVYVLVANDIQRRIEAGELVDGQRLPGEIDLAREYGVARMTVRRAARELTDRGLVRVVPGKGTFITAPKPPETAEVPPPGGDGAS